MEKKIYDQYSKIRETISANIKSISALVEQSQGLLKIIENIHGEGDQELKNNLEKQVLEMGKSIDALIKQTSELFDLYNELTRSMFG